MRPTEQLTKTGITDIVTRDAVIAHILPRACVGFLCPPGLELPYCTAEGVGEIEDRTRRQRAGGKHFKRIDRRFGWSKGIKFRPEINAAVGEREATRDRIVG